MDDTVLVKFPEAINLLVVVMSISDNHQHYELGNINVTYFQLYLINQLTVYSELLVDILVF